ncbi:Hypothetical protein, putative [Bodo saltans]|uniref:Uncharacterized protein n=1 Tax=Bodo saltans TaxID=75058 RepID=A0A0S4J7Y9_BODSA|nr:Hypothetical protein, putative [Bodo saltans]|eukprot:CUG86164.1 Hypothetical protein, putative [Bodo saltans]
MGGFAGMCAMFIVQNRSQLDPEHRHHCAGKAQRGHDCPRAALDDQPGGELRVAADAALQGAGRRSLFDSRIAERIERDTQGCVMAEAVDVAAFVRGELLSGVEVAQAHADGQMTAPLKPLYTARNAIAVDAGPSSEERKAVDRVNRVFGLIAAGRTSDARLLTVDDEAGVDGNQPSMMHYAHLAMKKHCVVT